MKLSDVKQLNEAGKTKARWVRDRGPEDIGIFELLLQRPDGQWDHVGFVIQRNYPDGPPTSGEVKLHHPSLSSRHEDPVVNLDDYDFGG